MLIFVAFFRQILCRLRFSYEIWDEKAPKMQPLNLQNHGFHSEGIQKVHGSHRQARQARHRILRLNLFSPSGV